MSYNPLVTIITPSFNQGQFIEETICSVLGQSYENIEYIVLDAMSTDNTPTVLDRYRDRISQIVREPDDGQSDAIVKGFKLARGELVGWINSDDVLYPDCVEKIVAAYEKNRHAVLFYNSKIDIIGKDGSFSRQDETHVECFDSLLRHSNKLNQPGSFYKNQTLVEVDYFNNSLKYSMDLDLWLRLLKVGCCVDLGCESIAGYREWEGTKTSTGEIKLLSERKSMLFAHGAHTLDKSILKINWTLIKCYVKKIPFLGGLIKSIHTHLKGA